MRLFSFVAAALALVAPAVTWAQLSFGTATQINDDWRFTLQDDPRAAAPEFDDREWAQVHLPHDWSVQAPLSAELASCTGYLPGGIGWYRKRLPASVASSDERVFLYFEGVYNRSDVYLNGHFLGRRPNGYVSFYYDVTPHLRSDRDNVIAVRVDHSRSADSRWYTGSGIYRNVHLIRANAIHLAPWGVFVRTENADAHRATLRVTAEVTNTTAHAAKLSVQHILFDGEQRITESTAELSLAANASGATELTLAVAHPRRWSVASPHLYRLSTIVRAEDGRVLDQTETKTGIRTLHFDADRGFSLNGESMKLKGVCLHHDAGVLGAAVPPEVWAHRLRTLKAIGANAVRTSHNPQATDLYELCDELGLLVLDEAFDEWEFPKRKWLEGWNVGTPGFEGSFDFFAEWAERDLADMVRRDRNHPSVFAWSIGNEVDYPNDPYSHPILDGSAIDQPMYGGYQPNQPDATRLGAIAQRLAAVVKQHDRSRPVTAALAGVVMSNQTAYPDALDIVGYNYTEDRYALDHRTYPQRVIYGSENRHGWKEWLFVRDHAFISGQFLWTGIDYLGEAGRWPARGSGAGLLDLTGAIKSRGHFRRALWSEEPVAYLGTLPNPSDPRLSIDAPPVWNYEPGTPVRVLCYTNAARARLLLNGQPVGEAKDFDEETGILAWDIPFQPGTLEVHGFDRSGAQVCADTLQTAGAPASLHSTTHFSTLHERRGVAMIEIQLRDAAGAPVLTDDRDVTCTIEGPARLLGLEAGNLRDVCDYTDATHRTFRGRLVAYVQAVDAAGPIRVRFASDGLADEVVIARRE